MLKWIFQKISRQFFSARLSKNFLNNAFVEAIPSPVFWLDHKKVYQGCNQLFSDLMGFEKASNIVGLADRDLPFLSTDLAERDSVFNLILSGETPAKIIYDCIIGSDDKMIWAQKRFTPLKNRKGKIIGVLGIIVDISEKVKRRKDMEAHLERQHILGNFLEELNAAVMSGSNYKELIELIEKFVRILQTETESTLALLIKANANSPQEFVRFSTNSLDVSKLFENRKILLKASMNSGHIEARSLKLFQDITKPINSIFCYRIKSSEILTYDEMVVLINPHAEKLDTTAAPFLALASHIIQSFYMHKLLVATKQPAVPPNNT